MSEEVLLITQDALEAISIGTKLHEANIDSKTTSVPRSYADGSSQEEYTIKVSQNDLALAKQALQKKYNDDFERTGYTIDTSAILILIVLFIAFIGGLIKVLF